MLDIMLKCEKCGKIVEAENLVKERRFFADYGSTPLYEEVSVCPFCGCGNFIEVDKCENCGEYYSVREEGGCLCDDCLSKATAKDCFEICKDDKWDVALNRFIADMFSPQEIEDILLDALVKSNADISPFINGDIDWFSDEYKKLLERRIAE